MPTTPKEISDKDLVIIKQCVDSESCPTGYSINETGIYETCYKQTGKDKTLKEVEEKICNTPIKLLSKYKNKDTKEVSYKLKFPSLDEYKNMVREEIIISGEDLFTRKGINQLNTAGLSISENCGKKMGDFFSAYVHKKHLSPKLIYESFGWTPDGSFVFYDTIYTKDGKEKIMMPFSTEKDNTRDTMMLYEPKGTVEGWIKLVEPILAYRNTRFMFYNATSSLILNLIGEESYSVLDTAKGTSSKGKTSKAKASMSMFGEPEGLKLNKPSPSYVEKHASIVCDTPLFIDEIHLIGDDKKCEDMVYMIANSKGAGRSYKGLKNMKSEKWNTVVLMTGEKTIIKSNSLLGAEMRLTEVDHGLGYDDAKAVQPFSGNKKLKDNYGVFAPKLITYIVKHQDEIKAKHNEHLDYIKRISEKLSTSTEAKTLVSRLETRFATMLTGGYVFEKVYQKYGGSKLSNSEGEEITYKKVIVREFKHQVSSKEDWSTSEKALSLIKGWIHENIKFFIYDDNNIEEKTVKQMGKITKDFYAIYPHILEELFQKQGFDIETVMKQFKSKKWLYLSKSEQDNHRTKHNVKIDNSTVPMYSFKTEIIDNIEEHIKLSAVENILIRQEKLTHNNTNA